MIGFGKSAACCVSIDRDKAQRLTLLKLRAEAVNAMTTKKMQLGQALDLDATQEVKGKDQENNTHPYMFNCRTNECQLLCLNHLGKTNLRIARFRFVRVSGNNRSLTTLQRNAHLAN